MNLSHHPAWPRDAFAGCDARNEERGMVIPYRRRMTPQRARKHCSPASFPTNRPLLRCLPRPWNHRELWRDALHRIDLHENAAYAG
jgi:hypothetical protein